MNACFWPRTAVEICEFSSVVKGAAIGLATHLAGNAGCATQVNVTRSAYLSPPCKRIRRMHAYAWGATIDCLMTT